MFRISTLKQAITLGACLFMFYTSQTAHAQIGAGSLDFSIDNVTAENGYSDGGTGATVAPGTQLTGSVSVNGVTGNGGTTSVYCYANGSQIFSWSTSSSGYDTFSWTPSSTGSYDLYCSGTWSGQYANGTVDTPTITVPVQNSSYNGFVNPKYVVVGVTYAPPGSSSYVQYTGTTSIGNTTTIASSFSNAVGFSVSVTASIKGWGAKGSVTGTSSTDYT